MVGFTVAGEHDSIGASIRPVQQAEPVRGRLHLELRPDRAVHDGEGAEGLRHLGIGLVEQVAGEAAARSGVEVAVDEKKRQFVGGAFGEPELPLAVVAHDPGPGEAGVHAEARHAHDVVVVPEHPRGLLVLVPVEGLLAGCHEILRPPVAVGLCHPTVEVDDREPRQRGGRRIRCAAAATR